MFSQDVFLCINVDGYLEVWYSGGLYGGWEVECDDSSLVYYEHLNPEASGRIIIEDWSWTCL